MNEVRIIPAINKVVVVERDDGKLVEVIRSQASAVVEIVTAGPQGPSGISASLGDISNVMTIDAEDGSLLYYDGGSSTFRADSTVTTATLTDGGNF